MDRERPGLDKAGPPQHSFGTLPPEHWASGTGVEGFDQAPHLDLSKPAPVSGETAPGPLDAAPVPPAWAPPPPPAPAPPPPPPPMVPPAASGMYPPIPAQVGYGPPMPAGAQFGPEPVYATWGQRFAGFLIDSLVLVLLFAAGVGIAMLIASAIAGGGGAAVAAIVLIVGLASSLIAVIYSIAGDASRAGQTVGRKAMGIRMVDATTYGPIGFGRAVGRYFSRLFSALPLYLGYFAPLWSPRKQTFHDSIVGTVVVNDRTRAPVAGVVAAGLVAALLGGVGSGVAGGIIAKNIDDDARFSRADSDVMDGYDSGDDGSLVADTCDTSESGQFSFEEVSSAETSSGQLRIQLAVVDSCGVDREFTHASVFVEGSDGCTADGYFTFDPHLYVGPYDSQPITLIFDEAFCGAGGNLSVSGRLTSTRTPSSGRGVPNAATEVEPAHGTNPRHERSSTDPDPQVTQPTVPTTDDGDQTAQPPTVGDSVDDSTASDPVVSPPAQIGAPPELPPATTKCGPDFSFDYVTANMFDRDPQTAWGTAGDASGGELVFEFDRQLSLSSVGLIPGYAKVGPMNDTGCPIVDRFPLQRQITSVIWSFEDGSTQRQTFTASSQLQAIAINEKTRWVKLRIESTILPVGADDLTFISEISMRG